MSASERGIGVADILRRWGIILPALQYSSSVLRCSTQNRCCSSTTTNPSPANWTESCISACVPNMISVSQDLSLARASSLRRGVSEPTRRSDLIHHSMSHASCPAKCCRASISVGAMMATWSPCFFCPSFHPPLIKGARGILSQSP